MFRRRNFISYFSIGFLILSTAVIGGFALQSIQSQPITDKAKASFDPELINAEIRPNNPNLTDPQAQIDSTEQAGRVQQTSSSLSSLSSSQISSTAQEEIVNEIPLPDIEKIKSLEVSSTPNTSGSDQAQINLEVKNP